jgi:hypothetical protein
MMAAVAPAALQPLSPLEKQAVLSRSLTQLFSRNILAVVSLAVLLVLAHLRTQVMARYQVFARYHHFFLEATTPAAQRESMSIISDHFIQQLFPRLRHSLLLALDPLLTSSVLSAPFSELQFTDLILLLQQVRQVIDQLLHTPVNLFPAPLPVAESPTVPELLVTEVFHYLHEPRGTTALSAVVSDLLFTHLLSLQRPFLAAAKSLRVFQLMTHLREFYVPLFGPRVIDDSFYFDPLLPLLERITAENKPLAALLQAAAEDLSTIDLRHLQHHRPPPVSSLSADGPGSGAPADLLAGLPMSLDLDFLNAAFASPSS